MVMSLETFLFYTNHYLISHYYDYYYYLYLYYFHINYIHNIAFLFKKLSSKLIADKVCHLFLCLVIYLHLSKFFELSSPMIQDDRILWVINKIVELRRDLTILNRSSVEFCNYLIAGINSYRKTRLCWHQCSSEHKFVVYVLSNTDTETNWDVYSCVSGVDKEFLWSDFPISCLCWFLDLLEVSDFL